MKWIEKNYEIEDLLKRVPKGYVVMPPNTKFSEYPYFNGDEDSAFYHIFFRYDEKGIKSIMFTTTGEYLPYALKELKEKYKFYMFDETVHDDGSIQVWQQHTGNHSAIIATRNRTISCILYRDKSMSLNW